MISMHAILKAVLCTSIALLLYAHDIPATDPVFWIVMLGLLVACLIGHEEGVREHE